MDKVTQELLRKPFEPRLISQFPPNAGQKAGLDYVNHAVVTDRLLSVDPEWTWEPLTEGVPQLDEFGGIWIKLTVAGVTRIGYGDRGMMKGADGVKNAISDAIKNAAMRFGIALDLWSKEEIRLAKTPGSAPEILSVDDLALIDKLVDHRSKHMPFDAVAFSNWIIQTFGCSSYDQAPRSAMPRIIAMLCKTPKNHQWPEGEEPENIELPDNLKAIFNQFTTKGE